MTMSLRERILSVYDGKSPDVIPFMLDLSHWFYHKNNMPWDLSRTYDQPEHELLNYHKKNNVGFYLPNLGSFYSVEHTADVKASVSKSEDCHTITWYYETPIGSIRRTRVWHKQTYSWGLAQMGIETERDLKIFGYAMGSRVFSPQWDRYKNWVDAIGDCGVVYLPAGYSAIGYLLNYWMGVEATIFAATDWPDTMHEVVNQINDNILGLVDLVVQSPAEVILLGDNFSSDIQPPGFFAEWSKPFYKEAIERIHKAGKYVAVHIDGRLRGALRMIRQTGADCADAVTPAPFGDMSPEECRQEAGLDFILSGGVPPNLWLPDADIEEFTKAVMDWLALKKHNSRFIASAGDQVPPYAAEERIEIMRDLVEKYGRT